MKDANLTGGGLSDLLVRLWHHLSRHRQRQFLLLLGLMLVSAVMEVVSLGAILPFLGVLTAPDLLFANPVVAHIARVFGIISPDQLLLPLTVLFVVVVLIAGAIRMLLLWASTRLTAASGSDISIEVYKRTLYQPYQVHVARNSSEVISGITNKVNGVVFGVLLTLMDLVSSVILLVAVMVALFIISPVVSSVAAMGFGISYGGISFLSHRRLNRNSRCIADEQTQVVKALQEGLGSIRDVLLNGVQSLYCDVYRKADLPYRKAQADNSFIGQSPRYVMEVIGMVAISVLAYGFSRQDGGLSSAIPMLGVLALGAQRLLPALHRIYTAWVSIVANQAQLSDTIEMLKQPLPGDMQGSEQMPLCFDDTICFDNVRFRYISDSSWVLDGLNFTIPKGARVGFVGSTGSGKSTTLDLLMGLLSPTEGKLLVDGQSICGDGLRAWQSTIAHVPQTIYLADTTLAENIAFGVQSDAIDMNRVLQAAHQAQIAEFIESQPKGYKTSVGERGIRLSGGQRQRIGIARALYKQVSVLVFDEATSALDNITEQAVMDAIEDINQDVTILLIAHRLTTVECCDIIFEIENGRVVAQGSYEQLLKKSPSFRKTAKELQNRDKSTSKVSDEV